MFYDVTDTEFFECTTLISKVLQIAYSNTVSEFNILQLDTSILWMLYLWNHFFDKPIKPSDSVAT